MGVARGGDIYGWALLGVELCFCASLLTCGKCSFVQLDLCLAPDQFPAQFVECILRYCVFVYCIITYHHTVPVCSVPLCHCPIQLFTIVNNFYVSE